MKKKFLEIMMVTVLAMAVLVGCGDAQNNPEDKNVTDSKTDEGSKTESQTIENKEETETASKEDTSASVGNIWFDSEEATEIVIDGATVKLKISQDDFIAWANENNFEIKYKLGTDEKHVEMITVPSGTIRVQEMDGEIMSMQIFSFETDLSNISVGGVKLSDAVDLKNSPNVVWENDTRFSIPIADYTTMPVTMTKDGEIDFICIIRENYALRK